MLKLVENLFEDFQISEGFSGTMPSWLYTYLSSQNIDLKDNNADDKYFSTIGSDMATKVGSDIGYKRPTISGRKTKAES